MAKDITPVLEGTPSLEEAVLVKKSARASTIYTTSEVDCWIGGVHYEIGKEKEAKVPEDVAAILTNCRKAYRR